MTMPRLSAQDKARNEAAIRAAMDRMLTGALPEGTKCDLKSLAEQAGVQRTGFYPKKNRDGTVRPGPYQHLAEEFERRFRALIEAGTVIDRRAAQIERLKAENAALRARVADREASVAQLTEFKTTAISRLAAQHEEILGLRKLVRDRSDNIRVLPSPNARASSPR